MGEDSKKEQLKKHKKKTIKARCLEVIYNGHLSSTEIFNVLRKKKWGIYKAFVKWHKGDSNEEGEESFEEVREGQDVKVIGDHTHLGIILDRKPEPGFELATRQHKEYFTVSENEPRLVRPLGRGNTAPLKKLATYAAYCCDGHDNGRADVEYWGWKYDHEFDSLKTTRGKVMCLLNRKKTWTEIVEHGSWDWRADMMMNYDKYKKMCNNWQMFRKDDAPVHELHEFKQEVTQVLQEWDPTKESLILHGDTNVGKTELAKALAVSVDRENRRALFCRNLEKIKFQEYDQPIIFDDMNFQDMERSKALALLDIENESDIRQLFGIHTIPDGTIRIFTTNEQKESFFPLLDGALIRRIRWIDLTQFGRLY